MGDQTDEQAGQGGDQPSQSQRSQGQVGTQSGAEEAEGRLADDRGSRGHHVQKGRKGDEKNHPEIDRAVFLEKGGEDRKQDERDAVGVKKHEDGRGPGDDRIQPEIRHGKRQKATQSQPDVVADLGEVVMEILGKSGNEPYRCSQSCYYDKRGQQCLPCFACIRLDDLREYDAPIGRHCETPKRHSPHCYEEYVDHSNGKHGDSA